MKFNVRYCLAFVGIICFVGVHQAWAQNNVGIGTREPNSNAALHIVASEGDQGLLIPTLTTTQRESSNLVSRLSSTENGLLVFDLDLNTFFYWMDGQWQPILSGSITQGLIGGEGIEVSADGTITNIGDTDSTNDITTSTLAEGDIEGTFSTLSIAPNAVTTEKLADGAVTTAKVANNSLLPQDLQSPGAGKVLITTSGGTVFWENQSIFGITFLPRGRMYIGDSENKPSPVDVRGEGNILIGNGTSANSLAISGDMSLSSTGDAQIQADAVTANEIASGAVGTDEIADGQVGSLDMADLAVTSAKLADDAVTSLKIIDGTIVNADVNDGAAITGTKITPNFGAQDINTSGNLSVQGITTSGNIAVTGKATSAATLGTDDPNTLTTKGYVDALNTEDLTEGNGITTFSYDGSVAATVGVNAGAGLGFDSGGALEISDLAISTTKLADGAVSSSKIADETIINNDISTIAGIDGTKISPNFGTQDVSTTGNISAQNITAGGKATSAATLGTDDGNTLTTKDYVDTEIANAVSSDRRLKKDIQPLNNTLQGVLKLKPSQYNWKDPHKGGISYGLIAQELVEVYPDLVRERSDGYLGIDYYELIPLLIKAIQEQQLQIQQLQSEKSVVSNKTEVKAELQELRDENQQLKQEIEEIKKALGLKAEASPEE
ncbi:tail fiber domain-containing protein [Catalinimonas sp. 4WD22]|uniref:tail fiber domain-containing protein n=1 Tax=Catalinimonas locisalis TaxID=3133978 RepID=UPI003101537E